MRACLPSKIRLLLLGNLVLVLPQIAPGQAPQPGSVVSDSPAEVRALPAPALPDDIEAIEVTGERESTSVQDEAEAVTRFGMDDLDKLNITNVDGLAANVPGLHVGQQGQAAIVTLRGIGTENASITGESGVAFHVDGIYYARPTAARVAFYDIRLIDVKRGPQGLLGGKNSTSGAIMVETNDPSEEYELQGDVLFGNYDRVRSRGHVNVPLGELAAFRTALFYEQRDGYLDNKRVSDSRDPFDADNFGFRSKLRLTPDESVDLVLGYNYFKETGNGPQADLVPILKTCGREAPGYTSGLPLNIACAVVPTPRGQVHSPASEDRDPRATYANRLAAQDDRYWGTHAHLTWDTPELPLLGATQVDLRGGYQRTESLFNWDFDATDSVVVQFPLDTSAVSHEYVTDLRWLGTTLDERLEWQTSLFFARERSDALTVTTGFELSDTGEGGASATKILSDQNAVNKSYGAALHGAYHISDALTFKLGGRWAKDRKHSRLVRVVDDLEVCLGIDGLGVTTNPDGSKTLPSEIPECDTTERGTMWGSVLEWRATDEHLLYVGIDRGYKSGGFQLGGVGAYGPERIWAYSMGSKSELLDGRLQLNLEAFFYNYEDMQIALIDGTAIRTENADTRMYGVELEASAEPIEGLRLGAVVGHLKTETIDFFSLDPATLGNRYLTNYLNERQVAAREGEEYRTRKCYDPRLVPPRQVLCGSLNGKILGLPFTNGLVDYSGNELSRAPKWKLTVHGEYEIPLGRFGSLTPRVNYSWQDDTYFRVFNRDFDLQEAYHKTDAKLLWESPEQHWSAEVFVENIEDEAVKDYILIGSRAFQSPPLAWYSPPRFYGVRVGFKY